MFVLPLASLYGATYDLFLGKYFRGGADAYRCVCGSAEFFG
jgi:hypothetical protein